jgi:hypothetical protein
VEFLAGSYVQDVTPAGHLRAIGRECQRSESPGVGVSKVRTPLPLPMSQRWIESQGQDASVLPSGVTATARSLALRSSLSSKRRTTFPVLRSHKFLSLPTSICRQG